MAPFYGWGSTTSRLQPLRGGGLLFTIQFPEIPGTPKSFFSNLAQNLVSKLSPSPNVFTESKVASYYDDINKRT